MSQSWSGEFAGGGVTVEVTPRDAGTATFEVLHDGHQLHTGDYAQVFDTGQYPQQQRQTVRNRVEESLEAVDGIEPESVADDVREWLDSLKEAAQEQVVGPVAQEITEGTETPVEIWEAPDENTTWHVTLTFRGTTKTLEFDAGVMVGDGSNELATKIVHNYHERVEITEEDWQEIADYWHNNSEVVDRTTVDENDEIATRVLSFLSNGVEPTPDRENLENSHATAWVDESNDGGASGTDGPVVWVRDDLLTDELETAGKQIGYKGQLVQDLKRHGHLHDTPGQNTSKRPQGWTPGDSRVRVWAFNPDSLGIDPSVSGGSGDEAHSEVKP